MLLSRLHTDGHLVEKDHEKAEEYLKLAAENGESIAQFHYSNVCFNNGDIDKANELIFLSAQSGYKPALSIVMINNDISYEDRLEAYQYYLVIDNRDGELDMMKHNTDIEIAYAELVVEQGDTEKFAQASTLISNFLQSCRISLSDVKFEHYLQLLEIALKYAKPTLQESGTYALVSMMFDSYVAEYEKRMKEFLVKQSEKTNQQQTVVKKVLPNKNGPKLGRNKPCSCGSGLKHKKCCM